MGTIIAIANQKGGVGKTTLAVHLAAWLARQGRSVALVDADPQGNATSWVLDGDTTDSGLFRLLVVGDNLNRVLRRVNGRWNVHLLPGNGRTGEAMIFLAATGKPFHTIAVALSPLRERVDHVLVDTPPSNAAGFRELLFAADWLLVPTLAERLSLEGVVLMARTCTQIAADHGHGPRLLGIVPNKIQRRVVEHRHQLAEMVRVFGSRIWPPIAQSIRVAETTSRGQVLFDYVPGHPVTRAVDLVGQRLVENVRAAGGTNAQK